MNPLTISLLVIGGSIMGYIGMAMAMHWFLDNVRKWGHVRSYDSMEDEKILASMGWPITLIYFLVFYYPIVMVIWGVRKMFSPLVNAKARSKRMGGKKFEIVK